MISAPRGYGINISSNLLRTKLSQVGFYILTNISDTPIWYKSTYLWLIRNQMQFKMFNYVWFFTFT